MHCGVKHDGRAERKTYARQITLDWIIYFNSLGQFYILTSGLSSCGVSVFFGRAFLYKLKFTALLEHQIPWLTSTAVRCIIVSNFDKICQSIAGISRFFDFSRWRRLTCWIFTRDIYAIARRPICHGNSVCLSVCLSVCHTGGSVKNG